METYVRCVVQRNIGPDMSYAGRTQLDIIYEINRCFLGDVRGRFPADKDRIQRVSLIEEDGEKKIRMAKSGGRGFPQHQWSCWNSLEPVARDHAQKTWRRSFLNASTIRRMSHASTLAATLQSRTLPIHHQHDWKKMDQESERIK